MTTTADNADSDSDRSPLADGRHLQLARALELRADAKRSIRALFDERGFLEVDTPYWVEAAGTDVHLDPVCARFVDRHADRSRSGYLHTSPEFAMKRLLTEGFERIWQMAKVWRNGEVSALHNPEFTLLEWYRARQPIGAIIDDVETLVATVVGDQAIVVDPPDGDSDRRTVALDPPFDRMTMQQVVDEACGFDLLEVLDFDGLYRACRGGDVLSASSLRRARHHGRWDELFFDLQVTQIDPYLARQGAVFVTDWPAPLAILAQTDPDDPRVARRFELYVGGLEVANGFRELTDPDEQRRRFEADRAARGERGLPDMPLPRRFLAALERGMPPASGVAAGMDRLLMLAVGAADIRQVMPFAMRRTRPHGAVQWG